MAWVWPQDDAKSPKLNSSRKSKSDVVPKLENSENISPEKGGSYSPRQEVREGKVGIKAFIHVSVRDLNNIFEVLKYKI